MSMDATLQVRMDADIKNRVEELYRQKGTSFAEVVRLLAEQSLIVNGLPFIVTVKPGAAYGIAAAYADPLKIELESRTFASAMEKKHESD